MKAEKIIRMKDLKDGDIFWWSPDVENNSDLLGGEIDVNLSGADQIFIVDDTGAMSDGYLYVNGGHEIFVADDEEEIVLLGHYSNLLKSVDKLFKVKMKTKE